MAHNLLDWGKVHVKVSRDEATERVEGLGLNSRSPAHPHGVADDYKCNEGRDYEQVGAGTLHDADRGREGYDQGAMAGRHATCPPEKGGEGIMPGVFFPSEDVDNDFDELCREHAPDC